jgi:VIT1/CCC1 family predicted Fe2+/Mn2+ transporter
VSCTEIIIVDTLIDETLAAATAVFTVITPFMFTMAVMMIVVAVAAAAVTIMATPTTLTVIVGTAAMATVQVVTMEAIVMDHARKERTFS